MNTLPTERPRRRPGRLFLGLGLAIAALGIIGYAVQLAAQHLWAPWYMPGAATLGVLLVVASLWRARTVWRVLALVLVVLLAGAEWAMLLGMRFPAYTGPVAAGQTFPEFTTARANGTPFTQHDLEGGQDNLLVFYRGHW